MPFIKHVFLCHQAPQLALVLQVVTSAERLMVVQHDIIAQDIVQSLAAQAEAQVHIIVCHGKPLVQSSHGKVVIPAHQKACSRDANHVIDKAVSAVVV